MNIYCYTLTVADDTTTFDREIREFTAAKSIVEAYQKVINIIVEMNKLTTDYAWTLKTIEHSYFVGINSKHECRCNEDGCCDGAAEECHCND